MWELPGAVRRLVCCGERLSRPKLMQVTTCGLCGGDPPQEACTKISH
jgi:hypothetical protein